MYTLNNFAEAYIVLKNLQYVNLIAGNCAKFAFDVKNKPNVTHYIQQLYKLQKNTKKFKKYLAFFFRFCYNKR